MNMNLDFKVIKYKHMKDKYYALYEMVKDEMWCIVVYADNEEEILFSSVELEYATALHKYNQIKDGNRSEDLY